MFLDDIYQAYKRNPALENLMVDPEFAKKLVHSEQAWRSVVTKVLPSRTRRRSFVLLITGFRAGCHIPMRTAYVAKCSLPRVLFVFMGCPIEYNQPMSTATCMVQCTPLQ